MCWQVIKMSRQINIFMDAIQEKAGSPMIFRFILLVTILTLINCTAPMAQEAEAWLKSDYQIVYQSFRNGDFASTIFAVDLDGKGERRLSPWPDGRPGAMEPSVSGDGDRIVYTHSSTDGSHITSVGIMNADGTDARILADKVARRFRGGWAMPSLSPDGTKVAFISNMHGRDDVFVIQSDGSEKRKLTHNTGQNAWVRWSPVDRRILFSSTRDGNEEIYIMRANGTGQKRLTQHPATDTYPAWSPDGTRIAFVSDRGGRWDIYTMSTAGDDLIRLTDNETRERRPSWSPDGKLIAYVAPAGNPGQKWYYSIFVMPADGSRSREVTSGRYHDDVPSWIKRK